MATTAAILLGGPTSGLRMRPLTLDIPKPLFPLAGRPIIWHCIQALSKLEGLREVILIGFYEDVVLASFVKETSRDFPSLHIRYMREYESLGTAGGLYHFRDAILKGSPDQIYVLHSDIVCTYPLAELQEFHNRHRGVGTIMGVKVPREIAHKYGCVVTGPASQAQHFVNKPESFISDTISTGIYLFDRSIFEEIKTAMDLKLQKHAEDPLQPADDKLWLEQDVIAPLAEKRKLYVYETKAPWKQIKSAGSALPANALVLASYKSTNPALLRRRSPTIVAGRSTVTKKGPEIVEPCYIDETAVIDPAAKIGPNVSIGAGVKIGYGARVKESIILDNTILDKNCCVQYAILSQDNRVGAWARVEGSPIPAEGSADKLSVSVLAKDVQVQSEVHVRSCIVLSHKVLTRSFAADVLL